MYPFSVISPQRFLISSSSLSIPITLSALMDDCLELLTLHDLAHAHILGLEGVEVVEEHVEVLLVEEMLFFLFALQGLDDCLFRGFGLGFDDCRKQFLEEHFDVMSLEVLLRFKQLGLLICVEVGHFLVLQEVQNRSKHQLYNQINQSQLPSERAIKLNPISPALCFTQFSQHTSKTFNMNSSSLQSPQWIGAFFLPSSSQTPPSFQTKVMKWCFGCSFKSIQAAFSSAVSLWASCRVFFVPSFAFTYTLHSFKYSALCSGFMFLVSAWNRSMKPSCSKMNGTESSILMKQCRSPMVPHAFQATYFMQYKEGGGCF